MRAPGLGAGVAPVAGVMGLRASGAAVDVSWDAVFRADGLAVAPRGWADAGAAGVSLPA